MAQPAESADWVLRPFSTTALTQPLPVAAGEGIRVGRAADNSVVLTEREVSSHHFVIRLADQGQLEVEDLGSLNGTWVDGERVERCAVRGGQVVRAGAMGPGFVVEHRIPADGTIMEPAERVPARKDRFGSSTMMFLRDALGIGEQESVRDIVQATERRFRGRLVASIAAVLVIGAVAFFWFQSESSAEIERLRELNEILAGRFSAATSQYDKQRTDWEEYRRSLRLEKERLTTRLQNFEREEAQSSEGLRELREQLEQTKQRLALYDPITREQQKLRGLDRVRRSVVFIETEITMRDKKTGKLLHVFEDDRGAERLHLGGRGEVFSREGSGSGFVVSQDGWILTNAHVVQPDGHDEVIRLRDGTVVEPELSIAVVFDGESERRPARVARSIRDDSDDFSLIKIEPFTGMHYIADFDTAQSMPEIGADVFLFGYPLGTMAIQDGERMFGSTFKGSLNRRVASYLQVDAAVHPGNSGGPLTDATGRVVGIVTAVQRMPDGQITPAMGYAIPVRELRKLWPPDPTSIESVRKKGD